MATASAGAPKTKIRSAIVKGKFASIFGWPFTIFNIIVTFAGLSTNDDGTGSKTFGLIFFYIIDALGILCILYGKKTKDRIRRFRRYVDIINKNRSITVDQIADAVKKPVDYVLRDLQGMIKRRYFAGAYIDSNTRSIIFENRSYYGASASGPASPDHSRYANAELAITEVVCNSCGARNQLPEGQPGECEYCGSPIGSNQ